MAGVTSVQSKTSVSSRGAWTDNELARSLVYHFVEKNKFKDGQAKYNVAETTVRRWRWVLAGLNLEELKYRDGVTLVTTMITEARSLGHHHFLSSALEEALEQWILLSAQNSMPANREKLRTQAAHFKSAMTGQHEKMASHVWLSGFLSRHESTLKLRKLQPKELARISAEDPVVIATFHRELMEICVKYDIISKAQMLGGDETGFSSRAAQHKEKEFYVVGIDNETRYVEERGKSCHISVLLLCDASGFILPPITIFEGQLIDTGVIDLAPANSSYQYQKNGYFEKAHFVYVLQHIIDTHVVPDRDPIEVNIASSHRDAEGRIHISTKRQKLWHRVLILDNASVHDSIEGEEFARDHLIHVVYLPPHLTHLMQVADVSLFASLKKSWYKIERDMLMRNDYLSRFNFWSNLRAAWDDLVKKPLLIMNGFVKCGQWSADLPDGTNGGPPTEACAAHFLEQVRKVDGAGEKLTEITDDPFLLARSLSSAVKTRDDERARLQAKIKALTEENAQFKLAAMRKPRSSLSQTSDESRHDEEFEDPVALSNDFLIEQPIATPQDPWSSMMARLKSLAPSRSEKKAKKAVQVPKNPKIRRSLLKDPHELITTTMAADLLFTSANAKRQAAVIKPVFLEGTEALAALTPDVLAMFRLNVELREANTKIHANNKGKSRKDQQKIIKVGEHQLLSPRKAKRALHLSARDEPEAAKKPRVSSKSKSRKRFEVVSVTKTSKDDTVLSIKLQRMVPSKRELPLPQKKEANESSSSSNQGNHK